MKEVVFTNTIGFADILWKMRVDLYNLQKKNALSVQNTPERRDKAWSYLLDEIVREVDALQATLIVVYIPYLNRDTTPPPSQEMLRALEDKPVVFLNLEPIIRQHYQVPGAPLLRFQRDPHPSAAGHTLIANSILKFLETLASPPIGAAPG